MSESLNTQSFAENENIDEEFPPPPIKPIKPANFSRKTAIENPASLSAQYLDYIDEWRDMVLTYNQLYNLYQIEILRQEIESLCNKEK